MEFFSSLGYPCYALTLRGHCHSRPVKDIGKISVYDYVEDVREVYEHLARTLPKPIVFGHSMGGLLARRSPSLCRRRLP